MNFQLTDYHSVVESVTYDTSGEDKSLLIGVRFLYSNSLHTVFINYDGYQIIMRIMFRVLHKRHRTTMFLNAFDRLSVFLLVLGMSFILY